MSTAYLLFCVHNHQPWGNFDHVFEAAHDRSYAPLLDALERHPRISAVLHHSGSLLEWLLAHRPAYIDRLRALAARGQVEILGGPFYEAILPLIPEQDALDQLLLMSRWCERHLSVTPRGIWLPERVWEPHLPALLARAGITYVLLDDTHLRGAGLGPEDTHRTWLAERNGYAVRVLAIDAQLRSMVPARSPADVISWLKQAQSHGGGRLFVYGDDGEKLGLWPGAFRDAAQAGWLDTFFSRVSAAHWLQTTTARAWVERFAPAGRVAIPAASYHEMGEWALTPGQLAAHQRLLSAAPPGSEPFIRGGSFEQFFLKYPEIDRMHKKMIRVSARVARLRARVEATPRREPHAAELLAQAQRALWRAQANDAYWHGLFAGLYAGHLRHAVHRALIDAEGALDRWFHPDPSWAQVDEADFDRDGHGELLVQTPTLTALIQPARGGTLPELSYKPGGFHLTDCLTRRPEAYHPRVHPRGVREEEHPRSGATPDPHPPPAYDRASRACFQIHLLGAGATLDNLAIDQAPELGDFRDHPWERVHAGWDPTTRRAVITLARTGQITHGATTRPLRIEKEAHFEDTRPVTRWAIRVRNNQSDPLRLTLGVELCFNLLAPDARDRRVWIDGKRARPSHLGQRAEHPLQRELRLTDGWSHLTIAVRPSHPAHLYRFPLTCLTRSEGGLETTYQGSVFLPTWELELWGNDEATRTLEIEILPGP